MYLILTQQPGDKTLMMLTRAMPKGTVIEVVTLAVHGNQARLGFAADKSIAIDREDIAERKRKSREAEGNKVEDEVRREGGYDEPEINGNY